MEKLGETANGSCAVYSECVRDFAALERLTLPSGPLVVFIAADASAVPGDVLSRVAAGLLDAGIVVISVWGPDCERVHDIFDDEYVGDGTVERTLPLITTWHADETLGDAVEFFAINGSGLAQESRPASQLSVAVGNPQWASAIESIVVKFCR